MRRGWKGLAATALVVAMAFAQASCGGDGGDGADRDSGLADQAGDSGGGEPDAVNTEVLPEDAARDDSVSVPDADATTEIPGPDVVAEFPVEVEDDAGTDLPTDPAPVDPGAEVPGEDANSDAPEDLPPETPAELPQELPQDVPADVPPTLQVHVNEVVAAAPNMGPDWVELFNMGAAEVDLSGWMLKDDDDTHIFTFPTGTRIGAGAFLVIEGPGGVPPLATLYGFGKADAARLFRPDGTLVDQTSWTDGQAPLANSWGRYPDGTGPFATLLQPTRGATNVAP